MAQKIIITAKTVSFNNPLEGDFSFYFALGNAFGVYFGVDITFVKTISNYEIGFIKYNLPLNDFAIEIFNFFEYNLNKQNVSHNIEVVGNVINLYVGNNLTVDFVQFFPPLSFDNQYCNVIREDYTFPPSIEDVVYEQTVVLSRSPYFFKHSPTVAYDSMRLDVFIYRGEKTLNLPTLPTFQASKSVIIAGQQTASIDIHKLVNDYVQNDFTESNTIGVQTTSQLDTVWVYVEAGIYLEDVLKYKVKQNLLVVDGFGYHTELANPSLSKKVLSSINNHLIYNNTKYPLYFISKNLTSITVNNIVVPFTLDVEYNNQYIAYIDVTQYASNSETFNAVFVYGTETITHNFKRKNECRNTVINCVFKNKFGFWQKIPFNKLSKKSLNVDGSDYNPFLSDFGSYSLNQHNKKSYLTNGAEKIICNTDFLPEEYNLLFKELMLSEQIYLQEGDSILPVNIDSKTFNYKTKLKDKLIQYSLDFTYSFKTINTVV